MQYSYSLLALLGLSASTFATPARRDAQLTSLPELPVVSTVTDVLPVAKKDLSSVTGVVAPVLSPVADILGDVAVRDVEARDVLSVTEVLSTISTLKVAIVDDVSSIGTLIHSVGNTAAGQKGLAEEIVKDLGSIVTALNTAVSGVLSQTLPPVLNVVGSVVNDVLTIVGDVETIVFQITQVLFDLLGGLLDSTFALVAEELGEVEKLLAPVLTPVLKFVGLTQNSGDSGLIGEVESAVGGVLNIVNGILSAKGLSIIQL